MLLKTIRRWRNSRGHGVHSPFAFRLITQVFNSKHPYYAFSDIPQLMSAQELAHSYPQLHHLSYRLIQHLKPANALEIGATDGYNTHYIASALYDKPLHFVHYDAQMQALLQEWLNHRYDNITITNRPPTVGYEAIFVNPADCDMTAEKLVEICAPQFFGVIYDIKSPAGKKLWQALNKMELPVVSFEKAHMGIIVKDDKLKKQHYYI